MPLSPDENERTIYRRVANILYPDFVMFNKQDDHIDLILINREISFPDTHTLIDHLRTQLATWHAVTQRELWEIIRPEVEAQIEAIVALDSDGF